MGRLDKLVRNRLRILRKTQRLRQADAAKAIGWAQPTISKYEKGEHTTDMDTLDTLARFYGTSLAKILSESPDAIPDRDFSELRAAYLRLDAANRAHLLSLVKGLASLSPPRASTTPRPRA